MRGGHSSQQNFLGADPGALGAPGAFVILRYLLGSPRGNSMHDSISAIPASVLLYYCCLLRHLYSSALFVQKVHPTNAGVKMKMG